MKVIYLLRHAKSSWTDPDLSDFDRPLNERGQTGARKIGAYIRDHGLSPQIVLCSAARRTRETLEFVQQEATGLPDAQIEDGLYEAGADALLARLRELPETASSVLLLAHNPGIQELALGLTRTGTKKIVNEVRSKYPTAALVRIEADIEKWAEIRPKSGHLSKFIRPRDL